MTTAAKLSFGIELWFAPKGDPLVKRAEIKTLAPPRPSRGTENVTTHDSPEGAEEFLAAAIYNSGQISGTVHYGVDDDQDDDFYDAVESGEMLDFLIRVKGESTTRDLEFSGLMLDYGPNGMEVEGVQMASFQAQISGPVDRSPTPTPTPTP
ncbi:MAG TPA: hypothetical protein PKD99_02265 [Sphingopyxis sp.]|nr:hypothetical protein [Sphingopyxis sp.]HMP43901.1 hypothetical protein [Sphingopyxis sp.]HMQ18068.1 hypothetical protein [Sphingopyxis sp.]